MKKLTVLLVVALVGCDGGTGSSAAAGSEKSADGFVAVPNISGVQVKVPDGATPNGIGGAAGFHTEDDSFAFQLIEIAAAEQSQTFDEAKSSAEEILFKTWIKSDKTDDGWVLTYETPKISFEGEEAKEVGSMYAFEVRRKIGDKPYRCFGSLSKAEGLDAVVDACNSLKAS